MSGHWTFIYLPLRILDIALVEMLGYWILGIGSLRILVIATLKTEQYSASGAKLVGVVPSLNGWRAEDHPGLDQHTP